jgi:hypothetical protein
MRNWKLLNKPDDVVQLDEWAQELERRVARPPRLVWKQDHQDLEYSGLSNCERVVELNNDQTVRSELLLVEAILNLNVVI